MSVYTGIIPCSCTVHSHFLSDVIGDTCGDGVCTSSDSCYVTLTCAYPCMSYNFYEFSHIIALLVTNVYVVVNGTEAALSCHGLQYTITSSVKGNCWLARVQLTHHIGFSPAPTTPQQYTIANNDTLLFSSQIPGMIHCYGNDLFINTLGSWVVHTEMISGPSVTVSVYKDQCLATLWRSKECYYGMPCKLELPVEASHPMEQSW
jgi:hypothetical protein